MDTTTITRMWLIEGTRYPRHWTVKGTREDVEAEIQHAMSARRFARFVEVDGTEFAIATDHLTIAS